MNKCKIYYHSLTDEMRKEEKLQWFNQHKLADIPFEHIQPDKNNNWINLNNDNDWEDMIPIASKETKNQKDNLEVKSIFKLFSLGIATNRDEWVYDFDNSNLENKIDYFINTFNSEKKRWAESDKNERTNDFVNRSIKWTEELETHLRKQSNIAYKRENIKLSLYRPFILSNNYFDKIITHRTYQQEWIFPIGKSITNKCILTCIGGRINYASFATRYLPNLAFFSLDAAQSLPLYRYDSEGNQYNNITDWALEQFQNNYSDNSISKLDIFNYVYGVLHNPEYRKKYELNLKREFPRIPFYDDFWKWAAWGKVLMDLHINFEEVEQYPLIRTDIDTIEKPKCKLKADKTAGTITLDENTVLSGVPDIAWEYKLGNRSALEWILDQYKEKKPKDPTIAEKFNTYSFADYKDKVIDLLIRVCTVSVKTMEIVNEMKGE